MTEKSLYERLGGVFAIAAVVDHFSDAVVKNPIVGITSKNPALREWHTKRLDRLPGLKFMRTLWVCAVAGGPFQYTPTRPGKTALGLEEAHRDLRISPDEFDEVAAELGRTLDLVTVPQREKEEVLAASRPFAVLKGNRRRWCPLFTFVPEMLVPASTSAAKLLTTVGVDRVAPIVRRQGRCQEGRDRDRQTRGNFVKRSRAMTLLRRPGITFFAVDNRPWGLRSR